VALDWPRRVEAGESVTNNDPLTNGDSDAFYFHGMHCLDAACILVARIDQEPSGTISVYFDDKFMREAVTSLRSAGFMLAPIPLRQRVWQYFHRLTGQ
jgi:hypothetical protein